MVFSCRSRAWALPTNLKSHRKCPAEEESKSALVSLGPHPHHKTIIDVYDEDDEDD